jgi:hypothetical protein
MGAPSDWWNTQARVVQHGDGYSRLRGLTKRPQRGGEGGPGFAFALSTHNIEIARLGVVPEKTGFRPAGARPPFGSTCGERSSMLRLPTDELDSFEQAFGGWVEAHRSGERIECDEESYYADLQRCWEKFADELEEACGAPLSRNIGRGLERVVTTALVVGRRIRRAPLEREAKAEAEARMMELLDHVRGLKQSLLGLGHPSDGKLFHPFDEDPSVVERSHLVRAVNETLGEKIPFDTLALALGDLESRIGRDLRKLEERCAVPDHRPKKVETAELLERILDVYEETAGVTESASWNAHVSRPSKGVATFLTVIYDAMPQEVRKHVAASAGAFVKAAYRELERRRAKSAPGTLVDELGTVVERAFSGRAEFLRAERVTETFAGQQLGVVYAFKLVGGEAPTAYAWTTVVGVEGSPKPRLYTVLGKPPVNSAADAVRAAIVGEHTDSCVRFFAIHAAWARRFPFT